MTIIDADVRSDLRDAHAATIADLGQPGEHLTATERIEVARVVRAARADREQPPWYTPSADRGADFALPAAAIDAAWRLTNHPGTLTASWHEQVVSGLPDPRWYVELVGIVAVVNSMDRLADMLSVDVLPLPPASSEAASGGDTESEVTTHWVPTAVGGRGPMVLRALSAVPSVQAMRERLIDVQYLPGEALLGDLDWTRGTLDRRQIELIAALTSINNECFY